MTTIQFELPEGVFAALRRSPQEFTGELRLAGAIHWYSRGEISQEQAAQVAGLTRMDFLLALAKAGRDSIVVDVEDLKKEVSHQYDPGRGDYTKDRHQWLDSIGDEEIIAAVRQRQERT